MAYKPTPSPTATPTSTPSLSGSDAAQSASSQLAALAAGAGINTGVQTGARGAMIPISMGDVPNAVSVGGAYPENDLLRPHAPASRPNVQQYGVDSDSINNAIGAWYQFDDARREAITKKMWFLGLIKDPHDFGGAFTVWKSAVGHAAGFAAAGRSIDPQNVLDMMGDASGVGKAHSQTQKTSSIDLTDPLTARQWITQAFQQSMGRDPVDAEIRSLTAALAAREKANPAITTSTTQYDADGHPVSTSSENSGGTNGQAFISSQAAADPEAGAHQAASTLYPALMQMLGAGG